MFTLRAGRTLVSHHDYLIASLLFLILLFAAHSCRAFDLYIGTGKPDSFSYFAGKSVCSSIKKLDKKVTCRLTPSMDGTDTLTNLQVGSLDLALVSSKTIYDAFHKAGLFQYIKIDYDELRLLMPFYRSPISLIVRRDAKITKVDDLVGKRVNGGGFNSLENQIFKELLQLKKWSKGDFPLYQNLPSSNAQDFLALKNGSVQAMLHVGMHPDWRLKRLLDQEKNSLLALDDTDIMQMIEKKIGFCSCKIPEGTYPGLDAPLKTLGMETFLIATSDTDDATVELVLTAVNEAKQQLQHAHPAFMKEKVKISTLNNSYLHPHPSALMFFQSNYNKYQ